MRDPFLENWAPDTPESGPTTRRRAAELQEQADAGENVTLIKEALSLYFEQNPLITVPDETDHE